jgi:hypothetical protein
MIIRPNYLAFLAVLTLAPTVSEGFYWSQFAPNDYPSGQKV